MTLLLQILVLLAIQIIYCNALMITSPIPPSNTRWKLSHVIDSQMHNNKPSSSHPSLLYKNSRTDVTPNNICCLRAIREATFGMGCFWKPSESMRQVNGVIDTVVGYAGGSLGGSVKPLQPPSYDEVCYGDAWVESVMVAYDDEVISYDKLLDSFWKVQEPREGERQYQSFIFPSDELQYEEAQRWLGAAKEAGRKRASDGLSVSVVNIEYNNNSSKKNSSLTTRSDGVLFYRAEEYHQEFWQKWRPRVAIAVFLLSASVDLSIVNASVEAQAEWKFGTLTLLVVGGLYYGIVERIIDDNVRELLPGAFAASTSVARKQKEKMRSIG